MKNHVLMLKFIPMELVLTTLDPAVMLLLIHNGIEKEITGYKEKATNNEMELMAALQGLMQLNKSCEVKLYSDSAYLINAFNQKWIDSWKNNGWKRGRNDEIKIYSYGNCFMK